MLRPFLSAMCLLAAVIPGHAQEVEVTAVRFNRVRPSIGSAGNWLEASVALNVRPAAGSPGQTVGRVRVSLLLGYDVPAAAGADRRSVHYRAEAECVALESGRADVRFYLPPEIVRRDQVQEPRWWAVELTVGGRPVAAGRGAYATALATPEQRRQFQSRAAVDAAANDGVLLPQYLTPFANDYPRATPSFIRREFRP